MHSKRARGEGAKGEGAPVRRGAGEGRRRHLRATAETSLGPALAHLNKHSQEARRGRDTAEHKGKQARVLMLASQLRTLPDGRTGGATTDWNKEHGRIFVGNHAVIESVTSCDTGAACQGEHNGAEIPSARTPVRQRQQRRTQQPPQPPTQTWRRGTNTRFHT